MGKRMRLNLITTFNTTITISISRSWRNVSTVDRVNVIVSAVDRVGAIRRASCIRPLTIGSW